MLDGKDGLQTGNAERNEILPTWLLGEMRLRCSGLAEAGPGSAPPAYTSTVCHRGASSLLQPNNSPTTPLRTRPDRHDLVGIHDEQEGFPPPERSPGLVVFGWHHRVIGMRAAGRYSPARQSDLDWKDHRLPQDPVQRRTHTSLVCAAIRAKQVVFLRTGLALASSAF